MRPSESVFAYLEQQCSGFAVRATRIINNVRDDGEKEWFADVKRFTKRPVHVFCMTQEEKRDFIFQEVLACGTGKRPEYVYHVFHDVYLPGCKHGRESMLTNACTHMYAVDEESFRRAFDPSDWRLICEM